MDERVKQAMEQLYAAECDRRDAISRLEELGWVRSANVVGDIGERIAADYYGMPLEPPNTPGYDLKTQAGRIQVRTMRSTHYQRTSLGPLKGEYELLFVLRLDETFQPVEAFEVPQAVIEERYGQSRVEWTKELEKDESVRYIRAEELRSGRRPDQFIPEIPGDVAEWGDAPEVVYADELPEGPEKDRVLAALARKAEKRKKLDTG